MTDAVSLAEARLFLRVTQDAEDELIALLIAAAQIRVGGATGMAVDEAWPAPLRLAVLQLVAHAYEHRDGGEADLKLVEPWLAAYREARL